MNKNVEVVAGLEGDRISGEKQAMVATKRREKQEDPWWMVDGGCGCGWWMVDVDGGWWMVDGNGRNMFQEKQSHP